MPLFILKRMPLFIPRHIAWHRRVAVIWHRYPPQLFQKCCENTSSRGQGYPVLKPYLELPYAPERTYLKLTHVQHHVTSGNQSTFYKYNKHHTDLLESRLHGLKAIRGGRLFLVPAHIAAAMVFPNIHLHSNILNADNSTQWADCYQCWCQAHFQKANNSINITTSCTHLLPPPSPSHTTPS